MGSRTFEVWRRDAVLARPVSAAGQRHERRPRLLARVATAAGEGFGEVGVQPEPLNGDPGVDEVLAAWRTEVSERLGAVIAREGGLPAWSRVAQLAGPRPASRVAWALAEAALLDLELRSSGLARPAGWRDGGPVPALATVSLLDPPPAGGVGGARIRAKVRPGQWREDTVAWLADRGVEVLLDYNASGASVEEVLADEGALWDRLPVVAVEQPFAVGDLARLSALAARTGVALSVDEGVRSLHDVRLIAGHHAARLVCVKPSRVGGLAVARELCRRAAALGLRPYVGGFFESPLGRAALRMLAADAVHEPSDVAAVEVAGDTPVVPTDGGLGYRVADAVRAGPCVASARW